MSPNERKRFWWRRAKFIERQAKRRYKSGVITYSTMLERFDIADRFISEIIKEENSPV